MGSIIRKRIKALKNNKGVSLIEVLLALAISVILIAMIALVISFSNRTLKYATDLIDVNGTNYESSAILNKYVRESKLITLDEENDRVVLQIPETLVGGSDFDINKLVYLYVDDELDQFCLDTRTDEMGVIVLAKDVVRVEMTVKSNGLGYIVEDKDGEMYYGFAYKRIT